jgi:hypothetical protein
VNQQNTRTAERDRKAGGRYALEFIPGAFAFVLLFLGIPMFIDLGAGGPWAVFWALVPLVPVLWMAVAVARHVARADEYMRGVLLKSLAIAFGVAMVTAITFTLLSTANVFVERPELWVFTAGMVGLGASIPVLARR